MPRRGLAKQSRHTQQKVKKEFRCNQSIRATSPSASGSIGYMRVFTAVEAPLVRYLVLLQGTSLNGCMLVPLERARVPGAAEGHLAAERGAEVSMALQAAQRRSPRTKSAHIERRP
jgi:hypothetical protein